MNLINQTDNPARILGWLPPTRRTLMFGGTGRFLALPYQVVYIDKMSTFSHIRMLFTQTEPTPDTKVFGLPLPCHYDAGIVCGAYVIGTDEPVKSLKKAAQNLFESDWGTFDACYPWSQRYSYKNEFVDQMELKIKSKRQIKTTMDTIELWEEVSRKDPNFILTIPLLPPFCVKTVKDLFTTTFS